jgi:hypothetical protein
VWQYILFVDLFPKPEQYLGRLGRARLEDISSYCSSSRTPDADDELLISGLTNPETLDWEIFRCLFFQCPDSYDLVEIKYDILFLYKETQEVQAAI